MTRLSRIATALLFTAGSALAATPDQLREAFEAEMVEQHQFDAAELHRLLDQAQVRQPILEAIARPAEKRLNWGEYRKIFLTRDRIRGGLEFWRDNADILQQAAEQYGVPPQIIVAIIGVETRYGRHTGRYAVLDALYTLGFHYPKRGKFFRSELSHFLRLAREEQLDPGEPMGSYAGAMGRPQFISSSYRAYAVDFDGDGKRDIWNNNADVIGSVANYFARHGWQPGQPVTQRVQGVNGDHAEIIAAGYKPSTTVGKLVESGVQLQQPLPEDSKTSLLALETEDGTQHWLGLDNFYVITRYNHSPLYAMAVYQLSEAIRALREQQPAGTS
jgi:membrane-bound lytic murein transglycosylase B